MFNARKCKYQDHFKLNKVDKFLSLVVLTLSILFSQMSYGKGAYLDVQSGSLMGVVHISAGHAFWERHHFTAGIGYVPKLDNHAEMSLYSFRYRYQHPASWEFNWPNGFQWSLLPFNVGITYLLGDHDRLFFDLPDQYPHKYYFPTGKRLVFTYQTIFRMNENVDAYIDFSIIDVGLASYVREPDFFYENYDFLGLEGITNWGVGIRYQF